MLLRHTRLVAGILSIEHNPHVNNIRQTILLSSVLVDREGDKLSYLLRYAFIWANFSFHILMIFLMVYNQGKPLTIITKHSILDVAAVLDPL